MSLKIAYLCGEYPRTTDTFIQREVQELRDLGVQVYTISVRKPKGVEYGTAEQQHERDNTYYLLPITPFSLLKDHIHILIQSPFRYVKSFSYACTVRSPGIKALIFQFFYFAEAVVLLAQLRKIGVSHVHNHAPNSSGYVTLLAHLLGGISYSITIHGFGILSEPRRWRLKEKIENALVTICVSKYAKSQAMLWSRLEFWNRIRVVHCGVKAVCKMERVHSGRGKHLLFVGRFDHVKGLPLLLDVCATLFEKYNDLHLDLVGDGPERNLLEKIVKEKHLTTKVSFHGYQAQEELKKFFSKADVFVMTSFAEGIPVVLMEAMLHGTPVVAPRIAGIPELVVHRENGLLADPGDIRSYQNHITELLENSDLRNMFALKARKKVESEFNLRRQAEQLFNTYTETIYEQG